MANNISPYWSYFFRALGVDDWERYIPLVQEIETQYMAPRELPLEYQMMICVASTIYQAAWVIISLII